MSAYLSKPVDPIEFMAHVKNALDQRRYRAELVERLTALTAQVHESTTSALKREAQGLEPLIAAAKARDPQIETHLRRVARIGEIIARRMKLSQRDVELFAAAAPYFDVGKIAMPDRILTGRGRLDPRDQGVVQLHAAHGGAALRGDSPLRKAAAEMAEMHHERFDGSGYPHKLRGEAIPLFARIIAVADVFVAMTSQRRIATRSPPASRGPTSRAAAARASIHSSSRRFSPRPRKSMGSRRRWPKSSALLTAAL